MTQAELDRARASFLADYIYESDSQNTLARRYGWALTIGRTIADVEGWPAAIAKVTVDDIKKAAAKHLDIRHSVTGRLIPEAPETATSAAPATAKPRT